MTTPNRTPSASRSAPELDAIDPGEDPAFESPTRPSTPRPDTA